MRAQDKFDFAVYRQLHDAGDDVVLGCGILGIEAERGFAAGRWIIEFRPGHAKLSVGSRVAEVPGKLHAGDLDRAARWLRPARNVPPPRSAAHQVQPNEEDRGQHGPDDFQLGVAVRVAHRGRSGAAIPVLPHEQSQRALGQHEDDPHENVGDVAN